MKSKFIIQKWVKDIKIIYWELISFNFWIIHIKEENGVNHFFAKDKIWRTTEKGVILTTPFFKITQLPIDDFFDFEHIRKNHICKM